MKRLGLLVNPVAGVGGRVGLKGSDGPDVLRRARALGAVPQSPLRAVEALRVLSMARDRARGAGEVEVVTYPGEMGEAEARDCGFSPVVIGSIVSGETTAEDTRAAARAMEERGVDLLLFAGGDGTARDICGAVGQRVPALGIPAGVKIHSGVFALTPRHAGEVALMFLTGRLTHTRDAEVMDVDEDAFRRGTVAARLHGYLRVPEERDLLQSVKAGSIPAEKDAFQGIAAEVVARMEDGCAYIVGPGTTTRAVMDALGLECTLLGVDVVLNRRLMDSDVNEDYLLGLAGTSRCKIILSVIGGQGYILGRGNQQISPEVLRKVEKENVIVVATREKLSSLEGRPLLVDTGDANLDRLLDGYTKVVTGFNEHHVYRVGSQARSR